MRLIDADAMKSDVIEQVALLKLLGGDIAEFADVIIKGFLQEIANAPTIDAVQVVRCKECKYSDECHKRIQYTRHENMTSMTLGSVPVDYCSRGERKDE